MDPHYLSKKNATQQARCKVGTVGPFYWALKLGLCQSWSSLRMTNSLILLLQPQSNFPILKLPNPKCKGLTVSVCSFWMRNSESNYNALEITKIRPLCDFGYRVK